MKDQQELADALRSLDGRSYKAYKSIREVYDFGGWQLRFDHVQGDPFADPTRVTALIPPFLADLPGEATHSEAARTASADYLNREFYRVLGRASSDQGSGTSGELAILSPGQEVLKRTSLQVVASGSVEARFQVGLPARGRRILGDAAADLVCNRLPDAVRAALISPNIDRDALIRHVFALEDSRALRAALDPEGLVAFVADGSVLPRRSGIDDRPLEGEKVVPFRSPDALRLTLQTPHSGPVSGMGIPEGVTLLVGGGFHGKSTLLRALQLGVYDHVIGDGRERVVTRGDAVKVRAEDGRAIHGTDISSFINRLPGGENTAEFHTENASGSTSQAAAIAEALEIGSRCLLVDEDTSATNFLIRDARVQELIDRTDEPITPFIDRVAQISEAGVSVVLVVGGSGDFFDVADTVVALRAYKPREVTSEARTIVESVPTRRKSEKSKWTVPNPRCPLPSEIQPGRGRRDIQIRAYSSHRLSFGRADIDLSSVEQLVEPAQTRAVARALAWAKDSCIDGNRTTAEALSCVMGRIENDGMDAIDDRRMGDYASFRIFELAAVLNRLRRAVSDSPH